MAETAITTLDQAFEKAKEENTPIPSTEAVETEQATQEPAAQVEEEKGTETVPPEESSEEQLLSNEEYDALKDNPQALRKALNRAYTQNRQKMKPWERLIESFETDADGTLQALAEQRGYKLQRPGTEQPIPQGNQTLDLLKKSLGPELDFLADKLAPAFEQLVKRAIEPIQQNVAVSDAVREVESAMTTLSAKHPDWQEHEAEMSRLGTIFHPAVGANGKPLTTQDEYLETMYKLATMSKTNAEQTKRVVKNLIKSAENSESSNSGVAANKIAPKPAGIPTFEEAAAAAKAGVRWES